MATIDNKELKVGDVVKAYVASIKDFGAFVDFDGRSGLVYYTQILPKVEHGGIGTVLSVRQQIDAVIKEIRDDGKIKSFYENPTPGETGRFSRRG